MKAPGDKFTTDLWDDTDVDLGTAASPGNPLEADFWAFHDANPHIYKLFDDYTRQALRAGYVRYSARTIIAVIRWITTVETRSRDYKINDHHSPYYGRLWMRDNPEHPSIFETRELLAGDVSDALKPS